MRPSRVGSALLAAALALAGTAPSKAAVHHAPDTGARAESRMVLVVPLRVAGDLPHSTRADLTRKLHEGLSRSRVELVEGGNACKDLACWLDEARERGATHVVEAELVVDDRVYDFTITAHDALAPRQRIEVGERCEVCGATEVAELVARQAAALGDRLGEPGPAPGELSIVSEPPGALIMLDGATVGRTPLRLSLPPGPHQLRATLPDHVALEREVEARRGMHETVQLQLRPAAGSGSGGRGPRTWAAGWALFGIGAAAIVPGIAFLAIDGQGQRSRCSGVDRDAEGDCRLRWETTAHGAALTAVGAALLATGVGLIVAGRQRRFRR